MPEPALVTATKRLEGTTALDPLVRFYRPLAEALVADPARRDLLRGAWLGHALHPVLSDLPIGFWTSATVLDLVGGRGARPAAQLLTGLGVLAAAPTALTGWAEWAGIGPDYPSGDREQRVGVVHALTNASAALLFVASWRARRADRHLRGTVVGLAASSLLGVGGYLGGHLASARGVASSHPALDA